MRAFFVIDANSEEIVFHKRFITIEQRYKNSFSTDSSSNIANSKLEYFPIPENAVFKLAFSRQIIQPFKLEKEKQKLPHQQDYKIDYEYWDNPMLENLQKQIERDFKSIKLQSDQYNNFHENTVKNIDTQTQGIQKDSIQVNNSEDSSHQNEIDQSDKILKKLLINKKELWPILQIRNKQYYMITVLSIIEDDQIEQEFKSQNSSSTNNCEIKLYIEENSLLIIKYLEFLQKIDQIIRENLDLTINTQKHNSFWDWFRMLLDLMCPFGTIINDDFDQSYQMLKESMRAGLIDIEDEKLFQSKEKTFKSLRAKEWEGDFMFQQSAFSDFSQNQKQNETLMFFLNEKLHIEIKDGQSQDDVLGFVQGQLLVHHDFKKECEIQISLSSKMNLTNLQVSSCVQLEEVELTQKHVDNLKLNYSIQNQQEQNLLSYQIPMKVSNGRMPIIGKYQIKRISQNQFKFWIKLTLHQTLQARCLRILLPLFEVNKILKTTIHSQSIGSLLKVKHPTQDFQCIIWQIVPFQNDLVSLFGQHELSMTIFIESVNSIKEQISPQNQQINSQYEDILLKSFEQLSQQNEMDLQVDTSENFNFLNKECLNVIKSFQELKTHMTTFNDNVITEQLHNQCHPYNLTNLSDDQYGMGLVLSSYPYSKNNQTSYGFDLIGGLTRQSTKNESVKQIYWDQNQIFEGVDKLPHLIDKQTYIKIEFFGSLGNQLISQLNINKVQFYPHRNGIEVKQTNLIQNMQFIIWNSLAVDEIIF
eukprot:403377258